jgi:hypothetical protein
MKKLRIPIKLLTINFVSIIFMIIIFLEITDDAVVRSNFKITVTNQSEVTVENL